MKKFIAVVAVAGVVLLAGCSTSPSNTGSESPSEMSGSSPAVDRQASSKGSEICVVNRMSANTFMNWTGAEGQPSGGYGEELLVPGGKSCNRGLRAGEVLDVEGTFMTDLEDGESWELAAYNHIGRTPAIFITTQNSPYRSSWDCKVKMDVGDKVVLEDGLYRFTIVRKTDNANRSFQVDVSDDTNVENLPRADGTSQKVACTVG